MKASTTIRSTATAAVVLCGAAMAGRAEAVAYGDPDCTGTTCGNPNVVMLVGLVGFGGEPYATFAHCSGSLLGRFQGADQQWYYLFLTAGHCTAAWQANIAGGSTNSVGVSFDPAPARAAFEGFNFDPSGFAHGGLPVTQADYGPENGWNLLIDYGAVSVPAAAVEAKWPQAAQIAPVTLASDSLLRLEQVVASTPYPRKNLFFHAVGYGITEYLDVGGNKGGLNNPRPDLGVRRVAGNLLFENLRPYLFQTGANPVRGQDALCGGDSGGPVFHGTGALKVQVGITSSGDRYCHSTNFFARTDITIADTFIDCVRANPENVLACGM